MSKQKKRATGTVVAAVCGFLTASFGLSVGLLQSLVTLDFVPGSLLAVVAYFVGGFVVVGVSAGVYTMRPSARRLGVLVYLVAAGAFSLMTASNLGDTPTALAGGVMLGINLMAAFSLVASKDVVVDGRTDTSDEHATDIGTGFH